MKSRVTTYILLAVVLAVWGLIAWKIFLPKPDIPSAVPQKTPQRETQSPQEDGLSLDYKDPFLKDAGNIKATARQMVLPKKEPVASKPKKTSPPRETPPIKYTGTIKTGGRVSYLFEQGGLQHALSVGEPLGEYILTETYPDSVGFTKNGELFTILIQK